MNLYVHLQLSLCTFTCQLFLLDIDECEDPTAVCPDKADCFNMAGSFMCHCLPGYKMVGETCKSMYLLYHQVLFQGALQLATPTNDSQIVTIQVVIGKMCIAGGGEGALKELREESQNRKCVILLTFFLNRGMQILSEWWVMH